MTRIIPLGKIPHKIGVAVSGGLDSMVIVDYLRRKGHLVIPLHFSYDGFFSEFEFLGASQIAPVIVTTEAQYPKSNKTSSKEEQWRDQRYRFFEDYSKEKDIQVITCHTLDDAVETYLFNSFHGLGKHIEHENGVVIRPFITTTKAQLLEYAERNQLTWLEDKTNEDVEFAARNRVRHNILPEVLKINPGIYKTVKKRLMEKFNEKTSIK